MIQNYQCEIPTYQQKVIEKEIATGKYTDHILKEAIKCDKQIWEKVNYSGLFLATMDTHNCTMLDKQNDKEENSYDWNQIKATLQKDTKEMSYKEYLALMRELETMIHKREDGTYDLDTAAIEQFIACGYAYSLKYEQSEASVSGTTNTWSQTAIISDTFQILSDLYKEKANTILAKCGQAYYDDVYSKKDPVESYVDKQIQISNLLSLASRNMHAVTYYSVGEDAKKGAEAWRIQPTISKCDSVLESYTLAVKDGGIHNSKERTWDEEISQIAGTAYGYVNDISVITHDTINHMIASGKQNKRKPVLDSAIINLEMKVMQMLITGEVDVDTFLSRVGIDYAKDERSLDYIEIKEPNDYVDELSRQKAWNYYSSTLCIGATVIVNQDSLQLNGVFINQKKLQRQLQCYNESSGHSISMDTAISSIKEFVNGKELLDEMKNFVEWSKKNSNYINNY